MDFVENNNIEKDLIEQIKRKNNVCIKNELDKLMNETSDEYLQKILLTISNFIEPIDYLFAFMENMKNELEKHWCNMKRSEQIDEQIEKGKTDIDQYAEFNRKIETMKTEYEKLLSENKEIDNNIYTLCTFIEDEIKILEDNRNKNSDFANGMLYTYKSILKKILLIVWK